ncbi:hypothetical protein PV379_06930 [Streptomyces caniscabiei]|uniref:hypothetical protein n=1 Tax=Streptomyces caniscabiei TaxID=2746961 RepID=UPI0029BCE9C9|nr:hypothetical protein [Streptomyces caniscabiei]MDX2777050.1 hypothetical protein [Streptomyces caniscabiei]
MIRGLRARPAPPTTLRTAAVSIRVHGHSELAAMHDHPGWGDGFMRPTAYFVVDALAKNAVGKIDKVSLRAAHAEVSARS